MTKKPKKLRVVWLANSPGPNQADFFDQLYAQDNIDLLVLYCAPKNIKWQGTDSKGTGHRCQFLFNMNPWPATHRCLHLNPQAFMHALSNSYDIFVISGYTFLTAFLLISICSIFSKPYVIWGEMMNRSKSPWRCALTKAFLYPFLRRAWAIFTMGKMGVESYIKAGIPANKIFQIPYSCDLTPYLCIRERKHAQRYQRLNIVITSRLVKVKRVDIAIRAFLELIDSCQQKYNDWDLIICGNGPLRDSLAAMVPFSYKHRVKFLGFVSKAEQVQIYKTAQIFLITSDQDGWGMVVPEAMAAGMPVVSTTGVESAKILLQDRSAGFLVNPGNYKEIANTLAILTENKKLRRKMGEKARNIAQEFDAKKIAHHTSKALWQIYDLHR